MKRLASSPTFFDQNDETSSFKGIQPSTKVRVDPESLDMTPIEGSGASAFTCI
jgi:hypothetical protein